MNCLTDAERERIVSMYLDGKTPKEIAANTEIAYAFKVPAHRLRDLGDDEGWKMAQEIAKGKGMLNL